MKKKLVSCLVAAAVVLSGLGWARAGETASQERQGPRLLNQAETLSAAEKTYYAKRTQADGESGIADQRGSSNMLLREAGKMAVKEGVKQAVTESAKPAEERSKNARLAAVGLILVGILALAASAGP